MKLLILWRLYRVWRRNPQLRLGQLIDNGALLSNKGGVAFFIKDEDLLESLERNL